MSSGQNDYCDICMRSTGRDVDVCPECRAKAEAAKAHARDWYVVPRAPAPRGTTFTDDFPRSKRTNICEIPDYVFLGGTISKDSVAAINCQKCLVMIDGFLAEERLLVTDKILPGAEAGRLLVHGESKT